MKKLLILLSFFLLTHSVHAQITLWAINNGSTTAENGKAIYTDKQGNSYVTGTFDGTTTIGGNTFVSRGFTDVFLMKVDPNGNVLWSTAMGSNTIDNCQAIYIGADNNIYIGGTYTNNTFYFSATDSVVHVAGNNREAFFAKYSPSGTLISKWRDGDFNKDIDITDIIVTSAGEVVGGGKKTQPSFVDQVYIKRFNTSGGVIWTKSTSYGNVTGFAFNSAGTVLYVSGSCLSGFNPFGTSLFNHGNSDIFYLTINLSSGSYVNCYTYGSAGNDYGKDIELDANNAILLGCTYSGSMGIGQNLQPPYTGITLPAASSDGVVIKFNAAQQVHWYRRAVSSNMDISRIRIDRFNNVFVHGRAGSGSWSHNGSGVVGPFTLKLHRTNGNILWRTSVPSTTEGGIGVDSLGNVYTTGSFLGTKSFGGISLTSAGANDLVVYKQGSINILNPSMAGIKCANNEYGDTIGVLALPTYPLNPGNVYTVEIDTLPSFVFASPVTIATLTSSTAPALMVCTIPAGTDPTYASIRVKTTNPLNTGEDIYFGVNERPLMTTVPSHSIYKCINGTSAHISATNTEPAGWATSTYTWAPMTSLTVNSGLGTSDGYSTTNVPINYTITVTSTNGCKDTQMVQVLQYPAIIINTGNDTTVCQGNPVVMNPTINIPGSIVTYQWTPQSAFTNPNILNAVVPNPYYGPNPYNLVAYDNHGCWAQDSRQITGLLSPTVNAGLPQYTTCPGSSFQLIATGANINTFSWQPSAYVNNPANDTVVVTPPATTTFTVTATNSNGCFKQDTARINIGPIVVNAGADATITCGNSTNLTASTTGIYQTPLSYSWSPPTGLTTTTGATVSAHPIATTPYTATLTTANGCTGTDVVNVNVNGASFPINFSGSPQLFSSPPFNVMFSNTTTTMSNYNFTWHFGDGNSLASNNGTVFHTYTNNGTYDVSLVAVRTTTGCADTLFQGSYIFCSGAIVCTLNAVVSTPEGLTTCIGDSLLLTANTGVGYTYQWKLNGSNIPGATSSSYYATQSGNYAVEIVQNGNCTDISSTVTLSIVPNPNFGVNFTATPQLFTSPPFISQFTNTTPNLSNYNFTWYWGDGQSTSSNNVNLFHTYLLNGTYNVSLVATSINTGCQDSVFHGSYILCSGAITCTLNAIVSTPEGLTTCIGDSLLLTANTGVGYTYQWKLNGSNIPGATSSSYYATQSGNYAVEIVENASCTDVSSTVTLSIVSNPNFGASFTATPQLFTSPPFISQFTNNTPNLSNYIFTWYWGDGQSTSSNNVNLFHTYLFNGTYDVSLVATSINTGCQDSVFQGSYIFCSGAITCSLSANVSSPNGLSACPGDSVLLTCNTSAGNTYQWKLNGSNISGAINSTYYATQPGNYSVEITESATCSAISTPVTVTIHTTPSMPVITQTGSLYSCGTDTIILSANSGYASYLWSNSAITQSTQVITPGTYQVTVSNAQGCTNTNSYILSLVSYPALPICVVGVDSITSHNLIVWNNDSVAVIDSFIVYREGLIVNQYDRIGAQSSTLLSTFLDGSSNPFQQAYRYKISQKDSCGNESPLSDHHCTIHLSVNAGVGNTWNLLWNFYEGFPVPTYHIYRGTTPSNIAFLTSLSGSNSSYTDLTPPPGIIYYQIEVVANNCDPSEGRNYNSSRSNIVNTNTTSIEDETGKNSLLIMPNPSTGFVTIQLQNSSLGNDEIKLEVMDQSGRMVYIKNIYAANGLVKENLYLDQLAKGVYTIRMISGSFVASEKVVIIHE